jgi:DNA-binding MarR family transcriptional regulator
MKRSRATGGETMPKPVEEFALESFLPYRLVRIAERVSQDFAVIYREKYGLSRSEWRCLATLGQFGKFTAKEIGAHSAMDKTKVSRAVAELERRGWLRRSQDPHDRRTENLALTANGLKAFQNIVPLAEAFEQALCAELGCQPVARFLLGLDALEKHFHLPPGGG